MTALTEDAFLPTLRFAGLEAVLLQGIGLEVEVVQGAHRRTWRAFPERAGESWKALSSTLGLEAELRLQGLGSDRILLDLSLRNVSKEAVRVARLAPCVVDAAGACRVGGSAADWNVFRQGYQSWTGTRAFRARDTDMDPWPHAVAVSLIDIRHPSPQRPGQFRSDMYTAIKNERTGEALVLGFLDGRHAFSGIDIEIRNEECTRLAACLDFDEVLLRSGESLDCAPLWLAAGKDEHALLRRYHDAVGQHMRARVPARNPVGWCSWYYYFTDIDEPRIVENLDNLAELQRQRPKLRFDYFQVDDGYQAEIGDWTTANAKFPQGMGWIAERIRERGFDAGIWTAPFLAKPESQLMRAHPDWFVRNDVGKPRFALWNPLWGLRSSCYALDTTHPRVLEWLGDTFHTIARDWGYRILKLDFLYAAALPGARYDATATRAQALRRGLDTIREAAGDEAFLLGCGCPLAPAIGVVDAMRIGPDVAPWWTNILSRGVQRNMHGLATLHAIRNTLTRAYAHRRWWLNDPDCLMVRDTNTKLTDDEVYNLASAIAVTDGMIVLSDRIEQLSPPRLEVLERTLALAGGQARIEDLLGSDVPELVVSTSPQRTVVAVFNFADQPVAKEIDLNALALDLPWPAAIADWWTGTPIEIRDGRANCGTIPPHGCRVLCFETERQ